VNQRERPILVCSKTPCPAIPAHGLPGMSQSSPGVQVWVPSRLVTVIKRSGHSHWYPPILPQRMSHFRTG